MREFFEEHGLVGILFFIAIALGGVVLTLLVSAIISSATGDPGTEILQNTMDGPVRNEVLWKNDGAYFYHFEVGKATCVAFSFNGRSTMECDFAEAAE